MGGRWGIIPTRGVYQGLAFSGALTSGSSPLARGLPRQGRTGQHVAGIIPARAGFTCAMVSVMVALSGSSPLARGLPFQSIDLVVDRGIIPARAGFTVLLFWNASPNPDHPRSRGVYRTSPRSRVTRIGSSPLARGLRPRSARTPTRTRIIPARAGFTNIEANTYAIWEDHPRSRGVYSPRPPAP